MRRIHPTRSRSTSPRAGLLGTAALLALFAAPAAQAAEIPASGSGAPGLAAEIDPLVKQVVDDLDLPGVSVAVSKKGKLVFAKGYGYANAQTKVPMDEWMRARIGSVSKATVTGPAAFGLLKAKSIDPKTKKLYGAGGVLGTEFDSDISVGIKRHLPIVEMAIAPGDRITTWYANGTVSVGATNNLDQYEKAVPFKMATGRTPATIAAIAINKAGKVYTWYDDGKLSIGSPTNLGNVLEAEVKLPKGKGMSHVVGIGIARSNDHVYVWYEDGTVSSGTSTDFDAYFGPKAFSTGGGSGGTSYNIRGIDIADNDHVYAWFGNGKASSGSSTDLDTHLAPYAYKVPATPGVDDWSAWYHAITLQNLLDHRAGFTRSGDQEGAMAMFDVDEQHLTYAQVHKHFLRTRKLMYQPGTSSSYSNHGFGLWTLLIEKISGKPYWQYVRDSYLQPLGLAQTVIPESTSPDCRDAFNHALQGGKPVPLAFEPSGLGLAAGGFRSSARDLTRITTKLEGKYTEAQLDAMGWGKGVKGKLSHNGLIGGGTAFVVMFPDGYKANGGEDLSRVHVAIVVNMSTDTGALDSLASKIALAISDETIAADYDLFLGKPANQCPKGKPVH